MHLDALPTHKVGAGEALPTGKTKIAGASTLVKRCLGWRSAISLWQVACLVWHLAYLVEQLAKASLKETLGLELLRDCC